MSSQGHPRHLTTKRQLEAKRDLLAQAALEWVATLKKDFRLPDCSESERDLALRNMLRAAVAYATAHAHTHEGSGGDEPPAGA